MSCCYARCALQAELCSSETPDELTSGVCGYLAELHEPLDPAAEADLLRAWLHSRHSRQAGGPVHWSPDRGAASEEQEHAPCIEVCATCFCC